MTQLGGTAISGGRIIINPNSSEDGIASTIWLVGGFEGIVEKRRYLKIVPNGKIRYT